MTNFNDTEALFEDDPGSLEEVIDDDDDDLKLDEVETKVWLVKVPKFLAEKWRAIDEENIRLGSIRIYNRPPPGKTANIALVLPEDSHMPNLPKEYSINITPGEVHNKFVFSEDPQGTRSISGTIHHECTATPAQFGVYKSIMRKRVLEADTPQRSTQVIGQDNQPVFVPGASSSISTTGFSDFIKTKKPKTDKEKATRMPKNELMDLLFAAFEKFPYWSFRGIVEHTKQPSQYLKEILAEICILNKRGPYTGNYQLKSTYKDRMSVAEIQTTKENLEDIETDEEDDDEEIMEEVRL